MTCDVVIKLKQLSTGDTCEGVAEEAVEEIEALRSALRVVNEVLKTNRFAGLDQNPMGVRDLVCSALPKSDKSLRAV